MEEQRPDTSSQEMLKTDRYLWIARAFSAMAVLSLVANVLLFAAVSSLYPLVRIQPFYLNVLDKNQQTIEITPISANELQTKGKIESFVRQYVLSCFEIGNDIREVEERFGPNGIVDLMSAPGVYGEFTKFYKDPPRGGGLSLRDRVLKEGLTVKAFIQTADTMSKDDNLRWQINLVLKEQTQSMSEPIERNVVIKMRVRFDPLFKGSDQIASWQNRLKNPLGFKVMEFKME